MNARQMLDATKATVKYVKRNPRKSAVFAVVGYLGITHAGDFITYSNGMDVGRSGVLQKLSLKGTWPCTYWAGQLAMDGFEVKNGVATNVFEFNVQNDKVTKELINLDGKRVKLGYLQSYSHWNCRRDTDYLIEKVTELPDRPGTAATKGYQFPTVHQ